MRITIPKALADEIAALAKKGEEPREAAIRLLVEGIERARAAPREEPPPSTLPPGAAEVIRGIAGGLAYFAADRLFPRKRSQPAFTQAPVARCPRAVRIAGRDYPCAGVRGHLGNCIPVGVRRAEAVVFGPRALPPKKEKP